MDSKSPWPQRRSHNSAKVSDLVDKKPTSGEQHVPGNSPVRTSDRLRRPPNIFARSYMYYKPKIQKKSKSKSRTAASQIAKMLQPRHRPVHPPASNSVTTTLRRSTRNRKISIITLDDFEIDNSDSEDDDLMRPRIRYHSSKNKINHASQDELSTSPRLKKFRKPEFIPRREGLRTQYGTVLRELYQGSKASGQETSEDQVDQEETENGNEGEGDGANEGHAEGRDEGEDEVGEGLIPRYGTFVRDKRYQGSTASDQETSEDQVDQEETENGNEGEGDGAGEGEAEGKDEGEDEVGEEGLRPRYGTFVRDEPYQGSTVSNQETSEDQVDREKTGNGNEGEGDGVDEGEAEDKDEGEDEVGEEEEQEGRRRYDLRNRAEVRRFSPEKDGRQRQRPPHRVLYQGMGTKSSRDVRKGGSRVHKRHRSTRAEDSDDPLLVDELDQGLAVPRTRAGNRSGAPWIFGGLDMHGTTAWGLNAAASGWGHQSDTFAAGTAGVHTAGPSSKGGADIQPLQVDESVSFDDIGGLSEYIDALKEMVFFPLLYPDFFANYHITPPRGVLLCGPPGTGKTLIARALACAASKAGQKVSFFMRKGADVLSKWVGEAERQLKLLFEEAQRNQPSIIFFDEIDGLAPVRSSKQEQIHNSIVSTLLALMDGLDSRGQVVLIGATNRIDAIDGALRRPGRFDREFNFPLPGYEARAEILDIHTRKWQDPPSKELRMELAASCVGYCGADLKSLCTEAAIRAFREKYPQVYTSDDKFLIDVDSVKVEKYHFLEAMATITPAAHRGSIVHSRPLSSVVAPCLQRHLWKVMDNVCKIFPFLAATDVSKLSGISYGSAVPLVYRPRILICGDEGVGLDHVGPAVLHELEKFPVHSLGLPALISDPSAKTPEEALVHIFGEARRTTPSILYLPQFQLWWETAHEQLKAVLLTLLEELPSDFPILLLGTSSVPFTGLDEESSVFTHRNVYQVDKPTTDDRFMFFGRLVEAVFSIPSKGKINQSKELTSLPEIPKAPKEISGPKVSELRAKSEAEQHALRRLRMCLRDVCNRILYDKRFSVFHYPVLDEDVPDYRSIVQNPMDIATLLHHVDRGQYLTCLAFLQDVDLIVTNAKAYNGDDYNGARIVSRAHELRDAVHGMLAQMDPVLIAFCDKIAMQGGAVHVPDDLGGGMGFPATPVVQLANVTRASARLRNVQPEVDLCQSYEVLRRPKKNNGTEQAGTTSGTAPEDNARSAEAHESKPTPTINRELDKMGPPKMPENLPTVDQQPEITHGNSSDRDGFQDEVSMTEEFSDHIQSVKQRLVEHTDGYGVPQLERLYTRVIQGVIATRGKESVDPKSAILRYLLRFVEHEQNF